MRVFWRAKLMGQFTGWLKGNKLMTDERFEQLLAFFKCLADANRLKIIGLLANEPTSVEDLAAALGLSASTVSHHLAKLAESGLVSARAQSWYNIYQLETEKLEDMARVLLAKETLPLVASEATEDAYARKVLKDHLAEDGRIWKLPTKQKELKVLLHHIMKAFEAGRTYTEREVNDIIARFNEDISGLRRDLIAEKLLARKIDGSAYWVNQQEAGTPG